MTITISKIISMLAAGLMAVSASANSGSSRSLSTSQIPLLGEAIFVEGIAYDSKSNRYFVGSAVGGSIQVVDDTGKAKWFQQPGTDGRAKALGLEIDGKRNRLWVIGNDAVYIYSLDKNELIRKIPVSEGKGAPGSFLNDVALDDEGNGYVTDSFAPNLFFVDGKSLKMTRFMDVTKAGYSADAKSPWNLNGIVITPDQKHLLMGKTNDGTLWRVSIAKKQLQQVMLSEPITFVDGLTWGPQGTLFVMRNFKNSISKIDYRLQDKPLHVDNLPVDAKAFTIPTTAVFIPSDSPALVVVNSQFEQVPKPFFLTKVGL